MPGALLVAGLAFALGVLTSYAQGWLPEQVAALANSSGSWVVIAFLLALLGATAVAAAVFGSLSLLSLVAGYVVGAGVRGYPSSPALLIFWGAAGVLVGPPLGLDAFWVRSRGGPLAALGAGALSGVLVARGSTACSSSPRPPPRRTGGARSSWGRSCWPRSRHGAFPGPGTWRSASSSAWSPPPSSCSTAGT